LLQELVHQGGLAMVDVGDDGDVTEGAGHKYKGMLKGAAF
jgi:hypothetical protein